MSLDAKKVRFIVAVRQDETHSSLLTELEVHKAKDICDGHIISVHRPKAPSESRKDFQTGFTALLHLDDACDAETGTVRVLEDVFLMGYLAALKDHAPSMLPKKKRKSSP